MDRRRCVRAGVAAAAAAALPPLYRRAQAAQPVWLSWPADTPWKTLAVRLALRLGYTAAEGLQVRAVRPGAAVAPGSGPRVHAGGIDFVLRQNLDGEAERAFWGLARTPQLGFALRHASNGADAGVAARLRDGRIGVAAHDPMAAYVASLVLLAHGVRPRPGQLVLWADADEAQTALVQGDVDAVCVGDPLLTRWQQAGAIRVLSDTRYAAESQRLLGGPVVCACLSASARDIAEHGPTLRALVRAVQRAGRWLQTASAMDLVPHADLADLAGDPGMFVTVVTHTRESWMVDGSLDERSFHHVLRVLRTLSDSERYEALTPERLVATRWSASG
ncbi:ABC transporter substrate-binding protein [Tepidimonas taiwanensis]|uniref:ABC transporter substrate-binding protein n=1 Tax=Tepidimonas taiwanensis TaxID=307486 RepID=UPI00128F87DA|nr:hypothetical protein [Tepidimonas taiwanensis]